MRKLQVQRRRHSAAQESFDGNKEPLRMLSCDPQTSLPIPPSHDARFDLRGTFLRDLDI